MVKQRKSSKLLIKPSSIQDVNVKSRFDRFNLQENPFPSHPFVNKDAEDDRVNGNIFEMEIRKSEYNQIENHFLKIPQSDENHLRLGYLLDTSYVGRGNGKSAFLVNLQNKINNEYCLDISKNNNKCFSIYISPMPGGKTKSFEKFVDLIFTSFINLGIIKICLATIRLEALKQLKGSPFISQKLKTDDEIIENLNSEEWMVKNKILEADLIQVYRENNYLKNLPNDFPLSTVQNNLYEPVITEKDFKDYYLNLRRPEIKYEFIFSQMVSFLRAANFNGAYILVDDFERIPDFQSARQKRDFAFHLRNVLYDGSYQSAITGFYNMILVLHAGVPRIIQEAWSDSGMEHRSPILPPTPSKHIVEFEKLTRDHAVLLLRKYLGTYRIKKTKKEDISQFEKSAINRIAQISELNAAKILKMSFELLEKLSENKKHSKINLKFLKDNLSIKDISDIEKQDLTTKKTVDLKSKAKSKK
jgi:hypothetical protein